MEKTVVALFENLEGAQDAIGQLIEAGFGRDDISVVRTNQQGNDASRNMAGGAAAGAGIGAVLGGLAGLLVGLGALAIPGIGPVIAAGPIATTLAGAGLGAATGGLVGALADVGIPAQDASAFAEGVRRGGTLVTVRTDEAQALRAVEVLNRFSPIDINQPPAEAQSTGWHFQDVGAAPSHATSSGLDTQPAEERSQDRLSGAERAERADYRAAPGMMGANSGGYAEGAGTLGYTGPGTTYRGTGTFTSNTAPSGFREGQGGPMSGDAATSSVHADVDNEFRSHWSRNYPAGSDYERYQPAYQYGWTLGQRYQGRTWNVFEADARTDWERSHPDDAWYDFRAAVYEGWDLFRRDAQVPGPGSQGAVQPTEGMEQHAGQAPQDARAFSQDARDSLEHSYDRTMGDMSRGFDTFDRDFRSDWDRSFRAAGYGYERYQPAYQYGYNLASDARYSGRNWSDIESDARRNWEARHPNDAWADFRDAVQHAWDRARGDVQDALD